MSATFQNTVWLLSLMAKLLRRNQHSMQKLFIVCYIKILTTFVEVALKLCELESLLQRVNHLLPHCTQEINHTLRKSSCLCNALAQSACSVLAYKKCYACLQPVTSRKIHVHAQRAQWRNTVHHDKLTNEFVDCHSQWTGRS